MPPLVLIFVDEKSIEDTIDMVWPKGFGMHQSSATVCNSLFHLMCLLNTPQNQPSFLCYCEE